MKPILLHGSYPTDYLDNGLPKLSYTTIIDIIHDGRSGSGCLLYSGWSKTIVRTEMMNKNGILVLRLHLNNLMT